MMTGYVPLAGGPRGRLVRLATPAVAKRTNPADGGRTHSPSGALCPPGTRFAPLGETGAAYRPVQRGARFSAKATTPSRMSAEEKQASRRAISSASTAG